MAKKKAKNLLEGLDVLTVPEAAKLKGVTDARIYQWIADGRLTKHTDERFGRTLVNREELESLEYMRRGRPRKGN